MDSLERVRRNDWMRIACTLALASSVAACSSGGGGGTTPPGGSANDPPPPPPPATVNLTLAGRVTDAPIPFANVTATVGDETFTATADAEGNYSLDIEIEEADAGEFVTLHAQGVDEQSFVEFVSLAGSFSALATRAGDDGTLSSDESFATQITNVSTAEALLLREANGGEPVTTDDLLSTLGAQVNGQDVLELAAAIKLAVDSAEDYPLPDGTESILDVLADTDSRKAFVTEKLEQDPERFLTTQTAIAQDPELTQSVDLKAVPERLTAALTYSGNPFVLSSFDRVFDFTFEEGGTGTVATSTFTTEMTWTVQDGAIHVLYAAPVEFPRLYRLKDCNGTLVGMQAAYSSEGAVLSFVSDRTVAITTTSKMLGNNRCPDLIGQEVTETVARTILADEDFLPVDLEMDAAGEVWTVFIGGIVEGRDIADIKADGTGTTRLLNKSFTWTVTDNRAIDLTFDDGGVARYRLLAEIDDFSWDILWEYTTPDDQRFSDAGYALTTTPDEEQSIVLTAANVPGRYYHFGIGNEEIPDPRLKGSRFRLDPGGVGAYENDFIDDNGNVATIDETVEPHAALRWSIEGNKLVIRQTRSEDWSVADCDLGTPGCVLRAQDTLYVLTATDDKVYWVDQMRFAADGLIDADALTAHVVQFVDVEDLP